MAVGFSPLSHDGREIKEADTHVESYGDVPSDAGSTPAASTTPSHSFGHGVSAVVSQVAPLFELATLGDSRRLHQYSSLTFVAVSATRPARWLLFRLGGRRGSSSPFWATPTGATYEE